MLVKKQKKRKINFTVSILISVMGAEKLLLCDCISWSKEISQHSNCFINLVVFGISTQIPGQIHSIMCHVEEHKHQNDNLYCPDTK